MSEPQRSLPQDRTDAYTQMRVDLDALDTNIAVMAEWVAARGLGLLPHVKTTMSAPIVARQLEAGAPGVTVATVGQAETAEEWGARLILIANQVVDRFALQRLRALMERTATELLVLVDSTDGVELLAAAFRSADYPIGALLDIGAPGGRTGVRPAAEAVRIARVVHDAPGVHLVGVSGYEGVQPNARDDKTLAAVDAHCRASARAFIDLADLYQIDQPIFTMGGSAFPDRVAANLPSAGAVAGTRRYLRSGCYVTHDHGTYRQISPVSGLIPAVTIRVVVLSTPEAGVAVLGAGKRELPHDMGLPVVVGAHSPGGEPKAFSSRAVRSLWDHHALVTESKDLRVGDLVDLGISHPCSAFARWDDFLTTRRGVVVDLWRTHFTRTSAET